MFNTIDVLGRTGRFTFLTDRWGEPNSGLETLRSSQQLPSILKIEAISKAHRHCFSDEAAFLVHADAPLFPDGSHLGIMIEFEWAEAHSAKLPLADTPESTSHWRDLLTFHAPGLLHAIRTIRDLPGPAAEAGRVMLDAGGPYGLTTLALLPLHSSAEVFSTVHDALFRNDLPFPPSRHAQLAAAGELTWRSLDPDIPAGIFPGASPAL